MDVELKPLIDAHYPTGEERVNHADLAAELEALHPHSFGWAMACCERRREMAEVRPEGYPADPSHVQAERLW